MIFVNISFYLVFTVCAVCCNSWLSKVGSCSKEKVKIIWTLSLADQKNWICVEISRPPWIPSEIPKMHVLTGQHNNHVSLSRKSLLVANEKVPAENACKPQTHADL